MELAYSQQAMFRRSCVLIPASYLMTEQGDPKGVVCSIGCSCYIFFYASQGVTKDSNLFSPFFGWPKKEAKKGQPDRRTIT